MFIFIDESGDLGFSKKSTSYFIVAAITSRDPKVLQKVFKKVRRRLKKKKSDIPEFKFSKTDHRWKLIILEELAKTDLNAYVYFIKKEKTKDHLRKMQPILYNFVTGRLVEHVLIKEELNRSKIHIVIDRSLYRTARDAFDNYVTHIRTPKELSDCVCISHKKSDEEAGLQAADFICGAVFYKLEKKDEQYYDLIRDKIRIENKMW